MQPPLKTRNFLWAPCALSLIAAGLAFLASCSSRATSDKQLAEQAVDQFHSQLDAEQYQSLYAEADVGLRRITNETDFVALLQAIHKKLGTVKQAHPRGYQVGWFLGEGTRVSLAYDTEFSQGKGNEQIIWHFRDGRPVLFGYHINSNDLITK